MGDNQCGGAEGWEKVDFDSAMFQLMSQDTSHSVCTSHASGSRSIQTEILNFPVNHILQVSCDWKLCCDWYALHGAGQKVALWSYPRPFPSVRNRVWRRETRWSAWQDTIKKSTMCKRWPWKKLNYINFQSFKCKFLGRFVCLVMYRLTCVLIHVRNTSVLELIDAYFYTFTGISTFRLFWLHCHNDEWLVQVENLYIG